MSLSDTISNTVGAADPTGVLSAAGAAIGLVGTVMRAVPALRNASSAIRSHTGAGSAQPNLQRAQTTDPAPSLNVDPERERRAYETVNFVLRELGSRICSAGLVDELALTRALNSAAQHIDFNLFSGEANRLFASLAPKLGDPVLVNSVFTSIYFIGALIGELTRSLPNYKESYVPLGPRIVQQLFRIAIGEGAFGENLTVNLNAYKTLATTAGLLRPTDIGYSAFPGFPAFSTCRYSSRSSADIRNHKSVYDKLIKHFDRLGFPQPISSRQSEVGVIREWRFMAGNAPSPTVDVEKADKNIGEGFGRVLHWLLCSADMMPSGEAVIVYYDQHIEFVRWIGSRMGFCVLSAATELDWTGNHVQLDPRLRAIANTWLIIMPSARAKATRRASAAQWEHTHMKVGDRVPVATQTNPSFAPQPPMPSPEAQGTVRKPSLTSQNSQSKLPPAGPQVSAKDIPIRKKSNGKTIEQRLDDVERDFNNVLLPQCTKLLTAPPADAKIRAREFEKLTQHIEKAVIYWLDGFPIPQDHPARSRKKAMIVHAQRTLDALEAASKFVPNHEHVSAVELTGSATTPTMPISPAPTSVFLPLKASQSQLSAPPAPTTLPPPYSPSSSQTLPSSTTYTTAPFPEKPPTKNVIRRKAPPPPRRAKALYDFEPEDGNDEELAFKEGDTIDVMTNSADATELEEQGWCKARVKGTRKIGLVPLEYIEIEQKAAAAVQAAPLSQTSNLGSTTSFQAGSMDVLDSTAGYASPVAYTPLSPNLMYSTADATAPQTITNYTVVENYKSQSSNSIEAAGLGVVAGGTTSGVTSVIQDDYQSGGNGGAQPMDQSLQQSEEAIDSNQSFVSNILIQNEQNAPVEMPQNENSENFNVITAAPPLPPNLNDTDSPGPAIDLSAFSMPPFDPQPLSPEPNPPTFESNPVAALASVDPYFAAQNPGLANAPDFDSAMAATQQQDSGLSTYGVTSPFTSVATTQDQSASDPDMYAAASPFTPMTTVVPPTAVPAPDAYLDPVTSPPGSPLPAAGEEIASVVVLSETSTGDAAGDYVEVNIAAEVTEGFDDEYC